MAGIYGVFLEDRKIKVGLEFASKNLNKNEFATEEGVVGRSVLTKITQDRFFETRNEITICFEGVNLSETRDANQFFSEYAVKGISFIKELRGTFSGFIYDRELGKIFVFNDNLSTKNIFYYYDKKVGFIFSSELYALSKFLKKEKINYSIERDAIYMMSLYGFLLEDTTYIKEVKKLPYGSLIVYDIDNSIMDIQKYQRYSSEKIDIPYKDALHQVNELVEASVLKNWQKDTQYTRKHISFLSGGMDSRANVLIAKELGFDNITALTFGDSNSKDVEYAQKMAIGEKFNHYIRLLNSPQYLIDNIIENYVIPVDGLMMFHTSAHAYSSVKSLNLTDYATIHTGQLGDALFGAFKIDNYDIHKNKGSIGYTGFVSDNSLLDKISALPEILNKYHDLGFELYIYEQRQINATIVGDRSLNDIIDNVSPFFDLDLINFCLSLPNKFKKNQIIYFDWLKKYHYHVLQYPWDKINMKPSNKYKFVYGKLFKKYVNGGKKYFNFNYDSMNPYHRWLSNDLTIINTLDTIFETEIESDYFDKEIKKDLTDIYNKNIFEFRNKFAVITALLAMKLYFDKGQ